MTHDRKPFKEGSSVQRAIFKIFLRAVPLALSVMDAGCFKNPNEPTMVIEVEGRGDGCRIAIGGRKATLSDAIGPDSQNRTRRAIVIFTQDTPSSCVNSVVAALREGGFSAVDTAEWHGNP